VLRAGIRRVVAAMSDPFPEVAGQGLELLRTAGVETVVGVCETESRRLNAPYIKLLTTGLPYIHAKWAMTLDGKIATRTGDSKWISNEASRRRVHELRGRMDAVVVGSGTVRADDPLLTARPPGPRQAVRVVVTSGADIPLSSQLVQTARQTPLLIATTKPVPDERIAEFRGQGAEVYGFAAGPSGRHGLQSVELDLGQRLVTVVQLEGDNRVKGGLLDAGLIDEVHVFIAPRLAGGQGAPGPTGGLGVEKMAQALGLGDVRVEPIDGDILVTGRIAAARSYDLAQPKGVTP
jgi:diaminohydroxyphosphoribosylaminopyrimidine deaminase/5-amino-6-(5-phosphoribosylamino)uracil reductase